MKAKDEEAIMLTLRSFIKEFPDEKRHPIVDGCDDWDTIPIVLHAWGQGAKPRELAVPMLRVITEVIYCMGYERGKKER